MSSGEVATVLLYLGSLCVLILTILAWRDYRKTQGNDGAEMPPDQRTPADSPAPYFLPPEGYSSPSIDPGCGECGQPIIYAPVVGGHKWVHLTRAIPEEHAVVMVEPWWDVSTGEWVEGNPVRPTHARTEPPSSDGRNGGAPT